MRLDFIACKYTDFIRFAKTAEYFFTLFYSCFQYRAATERVFSPYCFYIAPFCFPYSTIYFSDLPGAVTLPPKAGNVAAPGR